MLLNYKNNHIKCPHLKSRGESAPTTRSQSDKSPDNKVKLTRHFYNEHRLHMQHNPVLYHRDNTC